MPRILTFTMEITDAEADFFLSQRLGTRAAAELAPVGNADDGDGPVNTAAPAVDKNGVPWLEAVHAGTKALNNDGTWRAKRGVDKAVVAAAEAAAKVPPNISTQPENRVDPAAAAAPVPVFTMPGLPSPVLPPPAAPEPVKPVSYEEMSALVQAILTAGHAPETILPLYAEVGLTDVNDLLTNETLRANLAIALRAKFPGVSI